MRRKTPAASQRGKRIRADVSKQTPHNSYSPKLHYEDIRFSCRDCGVDCVWTAEQQRLWYEQWGGKIQSTAIRCRACREKLRRQKLEQKTHMYEIAHKRASPGLDTRQAGG